MITILLIEDEIKTARALKRNIEKSFANAVVLDILQTIKASISWLNENEAPDLIFSDIQLADGLSFEIFKQVKVQSPVIFCTAYDEYAIEAFKTNSIDYLLKPIDEAKLIQSIQKYHQMKMVFGNSDANFDEKIGQVIDEMNSNYKKNILVHFQEKIIVIPTENIAYLHHELGTVYLVTFDKKKYFTLQTLEEFELLLHSNYFFRVNRQFIINRKAIVTIKNYFSRRLELQLFIATPEEIIVSKTKAPLLLKWMEH